ncbi:Nucleobase cation symporter 2 family [Dillenia turbinata]|uniref:Nucleobase cation symporter 2 family n=1 Tax=Dillenia turbinata TaxID=194707 RepID=A0AAN8W613_9MAGN
MAAGGGGGGEGGEAKSDDFQPHPVKDQLPGVEFCVNSPPPWPEAVVLGFQHYVLMLGTTVLIATIVVPQMGGGNEEKAAVIQTMLFAAGINTFLQTLFGTRLPVVMGASFAFVIPVVSIAIASRYDFIIDPHERFLESMRGIQGALICASFLPIVIGFFGFWRIIFRFLSPLAAAPLVTLVGLGFYQLGFPLLAKCVEVGLPALILVVLFSQYLPHSMKSNRSFFRRFAVLLTVIIVWVYAQILTTAGAYDSKPEATQLSCRTDRAGLLKAAPWLKVPYPFQWGSPSFHAGEAFAMMAASLVALIESTGTFIAVSRYGKATPVPPSVISRGAGWQGISILLDGMFGTVSGSTASVENAGLLAMTQIGSRRVIMISAGFMLFFSVLGKFGALFASIPLPIFAAFYCIFFAYVYSDPMYLSSLSDKTYEEPVAARCMPVASAGLGLLQFCNLNSFRTKFILGFSLFLGLSVPQYFNEHVVVSHHGPVHTGAGWFNDIMQVIFTSPATVAATIAFLLDLTLSYRDSTHRKDSGRHWWVKFRSFDTDTRSAEFYSLPYNLSKYFPSF